MTDKKELKIIYVDIDDLKPWDKNPKLHNIDAINKSMDEFGITQPILVQKGTNRIIAGHGRYSVFVARGERKVPVVYLDLDDAKAKAYALVDNQTVIDGGWNDKLLNSILKDLKLELPEIDMGSLGFGTEMDKIFAKENPKEEIPPVPKITNVKRGDMFLLGKHRLICGDATCRQDVDKLMDGCKADMVFTDPPYNVNYGVSNNPRHKIRHITNDFQDEGKWQKFNQDFMNAIMAYCAGDVYVWGASGFDGMRQRLEAEKLGFHWSATIVWVKDRLILTPANYQSRYELCLYGWFGKSTWQGSRTETEVWEIERPFDSLEHPTMKPLELCKKGIINSSGRDDVVLDLFGGSGSTLIASHLVSRICYMMEIEPLYVSVILDRYFKLTGDNPIRLPDKKKWSQIKNEQ